MENKDIILQFPLTETENFLCARLMTSAVCSLLNIDIDETEDIKVCVNEACLMLMESSFKSVKLVFNTCGDLIIKVFGDGICKRNLAFDESIKDMGLTLLNSLIDEVRYDKTEGMVTSITLRKRIKKDKCKV